MASVAGAVSSAAASVASVEAAGATIQLENNLLFFCSGVELVFWLVHGLITQKLGMP